MNFPENIATNISKASGGLFIFYILYNSLRRVILSYYSNKRNIRIMLCHFCMLVECTLALELYTSMKWKTTSYHSAKGGEIILFHKGPTEPKKNWGPTCLYPLSLSYLNVAANSEIKFCFEIVENHCSVKPRCCLMIFIVMWWWWWWSYWSWWWWQ